LNLITLCKAQSEKDLKVQDNWLLGWNVHQQELHGSLFRKRALDRLKDCRHHQLTGRVAIFRQKNYSAEYGTRRNRQQFRRNSARFAEEKNLGIPLQTISRKRKPSEFRSELFPRRQKPLEFCSEPFLVREKPLEFRSKPFLDE
jgi:hypothetical protein